MNRSRRKIDLKTIEINIIVLTILLYLFRTTIPLFKFPFILFFFGLIIYYVFKYNIQILSTFKEFFRIFHLSIVLIIILIVSFLLSNKLYLLVFKDCFNAIILASLFFLLTLCITSEKDLNLFIKNLVRFIFIFAILISVRLLCDALDIIPGNDDRSSDLSAWILLTGSLSSEFNLNLIPVFLGMTCIFYFLTEAESLVKKGILNLILIIHSIAILLSGSRRGLIALCAIIIIFIFVQLIALFRKETKLKKVASSSLVFLLSVILVSSLTLWLAYKSSYYFRNYAIEFIGSKNTSSIKEKFALAVNRYMSIFEKDISYAEKDTLHGFSQSFSTKGDIFYSDSLNATKIPSVVTDHDPIRKWAAKLIFEDTTYFKFRSNLSVHVNSNKFIGDRVMRMQFGWQIFSKEFNWRQKLFGGGFNFMNWYGLIFIKDKSFSDYPHNPFLAVMLYSGVFGLLIYILFIFKVIYYYVKYFKLYQVVAIFYLIAFFFSFFSGNSPFDPPIMGFLGLLPFFIDYIHKETEHAYN